MGQTKDILYKLFVHVTEKLATENLMRYSTFSDGPIMLKVLYTIRYA